MSFFKNKKILVTGGAGSIGSALVKKLSEREAKVIALDNNETGLFDVHNKYVCTYVLADIRDRERMMEVFKKYKPEIVFHAAALKHVGLCEKFPEEAYKTNVVGLVKVLDMAVRNGTKKFIFISSDKAVKPKCVMGKTKKKGEGICRRFDGMKVMFVRFGNVLNSRGSVVQIYNKRIQENEPYLVVNDKRMKRFTMGIFEAVEKVLKIAEIGKARCGYTFGMGKQVKIEDLAKFMIKLSGKDLYIKYTKPSKGEKFFEELYDKKTERLKRVFKDIYQICQK